MSSFKNPPTIPVAFYFPIKFKGGQEMSREEAENRTFHYYQSGFHCAEAISKALTELLAKEGDSYSPKVASGFGGGIGGSHMETCGTLTGGIIALGWLWGRTKPGADKKKVYELASEFRRRFVGKFGSSNYQTLLDKFGKQENAMKCKKMTAEAAGILWGLLTEEREGIKT
jgi:C_GCAxxG_C_C family probable redox protein